MDVQSNLIETVQEFLKSKYQIHIVIPPLRNLIDTKINLKIPPSSLALPPGLNRYRALLQHIDQLFAKDMMQLADTRAFMDSFTQVINTDIDLMEKNEAIRMNSFRIKEKLVYRTEDIRKKKALLIQRSDQLHDKEDILTFIAVDFKNYITSIKIVTEEYEAVKKVEVNTPLRIDSIYDYEASSYEDYKDHYEPLLEVLVRLRSNIKKLFNEVENCHRVDLPLKCVNLLVNCKNLLLSLEEFLMTDHCSFNRLVFHVVSQQDENMKLISSFYRHELEFVKNMLYNSYKSVYLGHIFHTQFNLLSSKVQREEESLCSTILGMEKDLGAEGEKGGERGYRKKLEEHKRRLKESRGMMRSIKKLICFKQSIYLMSYLEEKICKKLNILLSLKEKLLSIEIMLNDANKYVRDVLDLADEARLLPLQDTQISSAIETIGRDPTLSDRIKEVSPKGDLGSNTAEDQKQKLFQENYELIQQKYLKLAMLENRFLNNMRECTNASLKSTFFPDKIRDIRIIKEEYLNIETRLLNSYQHLLTHKEEKEQEAFTYSGKAIESINQYMVSEEKDEGAVWSGLGFEILNEDEQCEELKARLVSIDKAEYLLKHFLRENPQKNTKELSEGEKSQRKLEFYRRCLEWLLVVFEGSMDEKIFESILDRMDYNEEAAANVDKNITKVNELLNELNKYTKQLKKITKQIQLRDGTDSEDPNQTKIYDKVYRITKERLILYELITTIYVDCLTSYSSLKTTKTFSSYHSLQDKGVKLFDKSQVQYVMKAYEATNKINLLSRQIKDINMPSKTKNYLLDDLYDPYCNRLRHYLGKVSEEELCNLLLRLEQAQKIKVSWKVILKRFEDEILSGRALDKKEYRLKLQERSREILKLEQECAGIEKLGKDKFVVHNMKEITEVFQAIDEHCELADGILGSEDLGKVCEGKAFNDPRLKQGCTVIRECFSS